MITKLIMLAARAVCVFLAPSQTPSTSPHVMLVTWFPGTQSIKSESDFIFNHSKSTAMLMVTGLEINFFYLVGLVLPMSKK